MFVQAILKCSTFLKEKIATVEEANKDLEIFKLERELEKQAESFTEILNEKDLEITKVCTCMYVCV